MLVCEHIWIRKTEEHLFVPIVWLLCFKIAKLRWTTNRGRHIRRRGKNQWVPSVVEAELGNIIEVLKSYITGASVK